MPRPRESVPKTELDPVEAPVHMSIREILEKRRKPKPHDLIPTDVEGLSLLAEAGKRPDILKATIGKIAIMGKEYTARDTRLKALAKKQEKLNAEIKEIAYEHDGLRGVQSVPENFRLIVGPQDHIEWDGEALQELLGELAYSSLVSSKLDVSISIPLGYQTNKGPLTGELLQTAIIEGLVNLGLPEEQLRMIVSPQIAVESVREKELAGLLDRGQVSSFEEAGEVTENWAITPKLLR